MTTITTHEFRKRMTEVMQSSLGEGELSIRVLDIIKRRNHFWENYYTSVKLELSITDPNTKELLVHIDTVSIPEGGMIILKDIKNAFTISFL